MMAVLNTALFLINDPKQQQTRRRSSHILGPGPSKSKTATSVLLLPRMERGLHWFEVTNLPKPTEFIITGGRRKESSCTTGKWGNEGHSRKAHLSGKVALVFNSLSLSCVFICRKQH